jgi:LmbE family N-acetylglucosaminyl deacetylase
VIAHDDVTCLVLAPGRRTGVEPRGPGAAPAAADRPGAAQPPADRGVGCFTIDVTGVIEQKVAALAAHRSQYALERGLFPMSVLQQLLGGEHFVVADVGGSAS